MSIYFYALTVIGGINRLIILLINSPATTTTPNNGLYKFEREILSNPQVPH